MSSAWGGWQSQVEGQSSGRTLGQVPPPLPSFSSPQESWNTSLHLRGVAGVPQMKSDCRSPPKLVRSVPVFATQAN